MKNKKTAAVVVYLVGALRLFLFLAIFAIPLWSWYASFETRRDVDANISMAISSASPSSMCDYIIAAEAGMVKHGMTSGHAAIIFKTNANNMAKIHDNLVNAGVNPLNTPSINDGTKMLDTRTALSNLETHTYYFWVLRRGWMFLAGWLAVIVANIISALTLNISFRW